MRWEPDTSLLDAAREIAPIIQAHSAEAERQRRLSPPVLKALRETGLLRMTTPRSLGGWRPTPTRALVAEEIARHDSAAAWTLENPLDWAFFCCRLPDEGAEEIYSGGADILIAAQFGRPRRRRRSMADTASLVEPRSSATAMTPTGSRRRSSWTPANPPEASPRCAWSTSPASSARSSIRGTLWGCGARAARHLRDRRVRAPVQDLSDGAGLRARIALSRPAVSTPGRGHGGVRYPDADVGGGATLSRPGDHTRPDQDSGGGEWSAEGPGVSPSPGAERSAPALRALVALDTLSEAWRRCTDGEPHSLEQKADLLLAMAHAMSSAVQAVELACSIAGTTAFRASSPLERCFRDIQTMRHHVFASEQRYGTFGQVCLGVPPDFSVVAF